MDIKNRNSFLDDKNMASLQDNTKKTDQKVHLKREIGSMGGMSLVVGIIIGSGIFVSPSGVVKGSGSVGMSLLTWFIGGVISICAGLAYAELGTMFQKSGGEYIYLLEGLHPVFAFSFAVINFVLIRPLGFAINCLACSRYLLSPFYNDGCGNPANYVVRYLAVCILGLIASLNVYSTKLASRFQIVFTVTTISALTVIIIGGFYNLLTGVYTPMTSGFSNTNTNIGEVATGFYSCLWAYSGWNNLNRMVEEVKEPKKCIPRSLILGILLVTLIYMATNISYFTVLTPHAIVNSNAVAQTWALFVVPKVAWLIPVFVGLSAAGSNIGSVMTSERITYVAARQGHLPNFQSMISVHRYTPTIALVITSSITVLYIIPTDIPFLMAMYGFIYWVVYSVVFCLILYLRWKCPDRNRPFKCPLAIVIISLMSALYIVFVPIILSPTAPLLYSALLCVVVALLYIPLVYMKWKLPGTDHFTTMIQMIFQVAPTDPEVLKDIEDEKYK